ncbi:hypothetical protein BDV33DRAFT_57601 [Aspergillus novoparasiticus]|uniref:Uncharacterized protein n=1 Tax=Aspergillus novoparasiticus TaxID=986946 RepID=A0A5N6E9W2_9EURO|nr:hypothetical protein BDV33DRAFT_57601 [Aspergillus novoparasiticus]
MDRTLAPKARELIREIQRMIPETAGEEYTGEDDVDRLQTKDGRIMYGGQRLAGKVSTLLKILDIGKGWGWTLWHFPAAKVLGNPNSAMYLLPLSDNAVVTPDDESSAGNSLRHYVDEPKLNAGSTVIIFMERS